MTVNAIDLNAITEALSRKADIDLVNCTQDQMTTVSKEYFTKLFAPSSKYVNLTLPASGGTVTAPADGWLEIRKSGTDQQYFKITTWIESAGSVSGSNVISLFVPMKKGISATLTYNASGTTHVFRFVYAEGEK